MTGNAVLEAISKSKIYDLGQPYYNGMPVHPMDPPFQLFLYKYHEHTKKHFEEMAPEFADAISLVVTSMHSGTHIDSPIHMSRNLKVLGEDITQYQDSAGFTGLPESLPSMAETEQFVLRTVLLDVVAYKGVDILPQRYEITPEDLQGAAEMGGKDINPGDAVLIRTGYSRYFESDPDIYLHKFAGLNADAATWVAKKDIKLFGIDNLSIGMPMPFDCHNILLSDHGIFTLKGLKLDELAADKHYESTLIVSPLKIKGGEASLVRPLAIA